MATVTRPLRVVQVGAGRFSRLAHGPALQRLAAGADPAVRLEGVCDLDPTRPERAETFKHDFGYQRRFADVDEMIAATAPDLIVCSVPPGRSAALLRRVLPRGIAVFTEKPPAATAREARELADLASRSRTLTYVAFNRRRMPAIELAKDWVRRSDRLRHVHATLRRVDRREPHFLIMTGVHAIDTVRYLAGDVRVVDSIAHATRHGGGLNVTASLQFDAGITGAVEICVDAPMAVERYTLVCEASTVDVTVCAPYSDASFWAGIRIHRGARLELEVAADHDWLNAAGIMAEHRACLRSIAGQAPPDCSLDDACRSMAVVERMEQASMAQGRSV